jgi:hypothetical protein
MATKGVAMTHPSPSRRLRKRVASAVLAASLLPLTHALAVTPAELAAGYATQSGKAAASASGQQFFTSGHGREWSCASCHGAVPAHAGKHAATGKPIAPLAPAFNAERFTDPAKVEKWFRRNCHDVLGRECSAAEKADVMSWLMTVKP